MDNSIMRALLVLLLAYCPYLLVASIAQKIGKGKEEPSTINPRDINSGKEKQATETESRIEQQRMSESRQNERYIKEQKKRQEARNERGSAFQVPDEIRRNSVGIFNNIEGYAVSVYIKNGTMPQFREALNSFKKSFISIPRQASSPITFIFELTGYPSMRYSCALERGESYQVFINQANGALSVALIEIK